MAQRVVGSKKAKRGRDRRASGAGRHPLQCVATFLLMLLLWVILSGRFDAFHLALGVISCLIVTAYSADILFAGVNLSTAPINWLRHLGYVPWLLWQIFLANLRVLYLACHPRMKEVIDPHLVHFQSRLKSDLSITSMAHSITLTPGTITVRANENGLFTVHAIDLKSGDRDGLRAMERRVLATLGE